MKNGGKIQKEKERKNAVRKDKIQKMGSNGRNKRNLKD